MLVTVHMLCADDKGAIIGRVMTTPRWITSAPQCRGQESWKLDTDQLFHRSGRKWKAGYVITVPRICKKAADVTGAPIESDFASAYCAMLKSGLMRSATEICGCIDYMYNLDLDAAVKHQIAQQLWSDTDGSGHLLRQIRTTTANLVHKDETLLPTFRNRAESGVRVLHDSRRVPEELGASLDVPFAAVECDGFNFTIHAGKGGQKLRHDNSPLVYFTSAVGVALLKRNMIGTLVIGSNVNKREVVTEFPRRIELPRTLISTSVCRRYESSVRFVQLDAEDWKVVDLGLATITTRAICCDFDTFHVDRKLVNFHFDSRRSAVDGDVDATSFSPNAVRSLLQHVHGLAGERSYDLKLMMEMIRAARAFGLKHVLDVFELCLLDLCEMRQFDSALMKFANEQRMQNVLSKMEMNWGASYYDCIASNPGMFVGGEDLKCMKGMDVVQLHPDTIYC